MRTCSKEGESGLIKAYSSIELLKARYKIWQSLDYEKQQRTINHIVPYIQLCSLLKAIIAMQGQQLEEDKALEEIIDNFTDFCKETYPNFKPQFKTSDFSVEEFGKIKRISSDVMTQEETNDLLEIIINKAPKYWHAHLKLAINFGKILSSCNISKEDISAINIHELNIEEFKLLFKKIKVDDFVKSQIDDLEGHALLNQLLVFIDRNLITIRRVLEDLDLEDYKNFLNEFNHKKDFNLMLDRKEIDFNSDFKNFPLEIKVGYEIEFRLFRIDGKASAIDDVHAATADLPARAKKQDQYRKPITVNSVTNLKSLLQAVVDVDYLGRELDLYLIKRDLRENYLNLPEGCRISHDELMTQIDKLSHIEILFYKLLILDSKYDIEIDGVTPLVDIGEKSGIDKKTMLRENIIKLIEEDNFHKKLLDMIQANEIAYGPFPLNEALDKNDKIISWLEATANKTGLKITPPNVQLNLSFKDEGQDILLPRISEGRLQISELGKKILEIIQEVLAEHPEMLRSQDKISARLDLMKNINSLKGYATEIKEFYQKFDETKTAFSEHKRLAAKDVPLRVSVLTNPETGVLELRLIGANPHFANVPNASEFHCYGAKDIPHLLLPEIQKAIFTEMTNLGQDTIKEMRGKFVDIQQDGTIVGLEEKTVLHSSYVKYNKLAPLDLLKSLRDESKKSLARFC
jgi:hypothetical protein